MNENGLSSVEQDQYVAMAAAIRSQLARQIEYMPAMKPEEIGALIKAIDDAQWLEVKSLSFDESVEERRKSLERGAIYGS